MNQKLLWQDLMNRNSNKIFSVNVTDKNGIFYVAYMVINDRMNKKLASDKLNIDKIKLEDYGSVYCSIPGDFVSPALEENIISRMKSKYF